MLIEQLRVSIHSFKCGGVYAEFTMMVLQSHMCHFLSIGGTNLVGQLHCTFSIGELLTICNNVNVSISDK